MFWKKWGGGTRLSVDYRFCFLYVIGSFSVICGHLGNGINLFYDWFDPYSFHLPLFLFSSGYFFNKEKSDNVSNYVSHKVKTLLIPLYLWNFVYAGIVIITHKLGFTIGWSVTIKSLLWGPFYNGHQFDYNCPSWFVAPLFLVHVFNILLRKIIRKLGINENEYVITALYFVIAYFSYDFLQNPLLGEISLPLAHMFTMLPYYGVGTLYKEAIEGKYKIKTVVYFTIVFVGTLTLKHITGECLSYNIVLFSIGERKNYFLLSYIQTFLGIAFWLKISNILLPIIQGKKWIKAISDSAFSIMVNQLFIAMLIKTVFAIIFIYTPFCGNFDLQKYYSELYYIYCPKGNNHWCLLYDLAALIVPVYIQHFINKTKGICTQKIDSLNKKIKDNA